MVAKVRREVAVDSAEGADIEKFGIKDAEEVKGLSWGGPDAHRIAASGGGDGKGVLAGEFAQREFGRQQRMHGVVEGERLIDPDMGAHRVVGVSAWRRRADGEAELGGRHAGDIFTECVEVGIVPLGQNHEGDKDGNVELLEGFEGLLVFCMCGALMDFAQHGVAGKLEADEGGV